MNNAMKFSATLIAMALAGCGGGGGGGGGSSTPSTPNTGGSSTPNPGNLAASVPAPTYAANSAELAAFNALQSMRQSGGYGLLTQQTTLDNAAAAHVSYYILNGFPGGYMDNSGPAFIFQGVNSAHYEAVGYPGFTGTTPLARIVAAGYSGNYSGEAIAYPDGQLSKGTSAAALSGQNCVDLFANTVYHRLVLIDPNMRDVGIGYQVAAKGTAVCDIEVAANAQSVTPDGFLAVMPLPNATVTTALVAEDPAPVPASKTKAFPVSLMIGLKHTLVVTSFTLKDAAGLNVPGVILTTKTDDNIYTGNVAFFVPTQAYVSGMTYTASFVGTDEGQPINKTWSYKAQ